MGECELSYWIECIHSTFQGALESWPEMKKKKQGVHMTAPKKTHHLKVLVLGRGSEQNTELCEFIILWKTFRSASRALGLHFRSQVLHAHVRSVDPSARSLIVSSLSTCPGRPEKTCLSVEGCWRQSELHATSFPLSFPSSFLLSPFCPLHFLISFHSLFPPLSLPSFFAFILFSS